MQIVEHPTIFHLNQIHEWLCVEDREDGRGFFVNWEVIQSAFEEGKLWVVVLGTAAVGFLTWGKLGKEGWIDILEVQPAFRRKGIGRVLAESIINRFREVGIQRIKIQSEPTTSEPFWLGLGFAEDEENICERIRGVPMRNLYLYKRIG